MEETYIFEKRMQTRIFSTLIIRQRSGIIFRVAIALGFETLPEKAKSVYIR